MVAPGRSRLFGLLADGTPTVTIAACFPLGDGDRGTAPRTVNGKVIMQS